MNPGPAKENKSGIHEPPVYIPILVEAMILLAGKLSHIFWAMSRGFSFIPDS